jgi:hypothetical protein
MTNNDMVVCGGLCGKRFNREDALKKGLLYETNICHECYASWSQDPQQCFGKKTAKGVSLANKDDPTCAQCQEFNVCINWNRPEQTKKEKKTTEEAKMSKDDTTTTAVDIPDEDFQPLEDETVLEPATPEAVPNQEPAPETEPVTEVNQQPAPARVRKMRAPAQKPAPQQKQRPQRKAVAKAVPAPKAVEKKTPKRGTVKAVPVAKAAKVGKVTPTEKPETPYQDGSARDLMFRKLLSRYCTKEEVIELGKGVAKNPDAVFAANFYPRRNKRDNNERFFKWNVVERGGKFKVVIK